MKKRYWLSLMNTQIDWCLTAFESFFIVNTVCINRREVYVLHETFFLPFVVFIGLCCKFHILANAFNARRKWIWIYSHWFGWNRNERINNFVCLQDTATCHTNVVENSHRMQPVWNENPLSARIPCDDLSDTYRLPSLEKVNHIELCHCARANTKNQIVWPIWILLIDSICDINLFVCVKNVFCFCNNCKFIFMLKQLFSIKEQKQIENWTESP